MLQNLDFDFEKCCSICLSHVNVYVCLVCGKYFQVPLWCRAATLARLMIDCFEPPLPPQGRGPSTFAYTHSLETNHHMYMKLDTGKVRLLAEQVR